MMSPMSSEAAVDVVLARHDLAAARAALDEAVAAAPDLCRQRIMATPGLLGLLVRVVSAKKHLKALELLLTAKTRASMAQ
jgi:hypothetical protein